jgi:hypothetical protein
MPVLPPQTLLGRFLLFALFFVYKLLGKFFDRGYLLESGDPEETGGA